ncbi:MAG: ABC transporter permease, partial [Spirochaetes bacterium]|nr:ABC transporter permease [Spirochaetota bacterium]
MKLLHIALRNIFRNRRRSVLNLIALTTGFVVLLLGLGWVQGYHSYVYGSMIDLETGHAHYLAKGYLEEQRRLPVDIGISNYAEL